MKSKQQWTNIAFHNTVALIIQMALSAQEPVIYCQHGFVRVLLGTFFCMSCNVVINEKEMNIKCMDLGINHCKTINQIKKK